MKRSLDATADLPVRTKRLNTGEHEDVDQHKGDNKSAEQHHVEGQHDYEEQYDHAEQQDKQESGLPIQHTISDAWKRHVAQKEQASFFDLAQELRDQIYQECTVDIAYSNGPHQSALVLNQQFSDQYILSMLKELQLVVFVSFQEPNLSAEAPWYDSLPAWTRNGVHTVRLVLSFPCWLTYGFEFDLGHHTADDFYQCVQARVDDATAHLPALRSLDVMIAFDNWTYEYNYDILADTMMQHVQPHVLLDIRPSAAQITTYGLGMLVDIPSFSTPHDLDEDYDHGYGLWWQQLEEELAQREGTYVDDEYFYEYVEKYQEREGKIARWYLTASTLDSSRNHLGVDWRFIAEFRPDRKRSTTDHS